MKIGIIGRPHAGKSALFELFTGQKAFGNGRPQLAAGKVPDSRVDVLAGLYKPKKITYASIDFLDVPGFMPGQQQGGRGFLQAVRDVDALILVARAFHSDAAPSLNGIQPFEDFNEIQQELLVADWSLLETRLERLQKDRIRNPRAEQELAPLQNCLHLVEQGLPLRRLDADQEEERVLRTYDFLTRKPLIVAVNLDENQMQKATYPGHAELEAETERVGLPLIQFSAKIEAEIGELEKDEGQIFMAELGLTESGIARIARTVYSHLGLISYFTAGETEVHAWTIKRGATAKEAAGKIHSDLERGFIRAEVVSYADLVQHGSMRAVKEKGLFRLEGKDYIVEDGDVITFRFNV